jgi:hypothetical protein
MTKKQSRYLLAAGIFLLAYSIFSIVVGADFVKNGGLDPVTDPTVGSPWEFVLGGVIGIPSAIIAIYLSRKK